MRKFLSSILEVIEVALVAVVSVFLIRTFLIQPFLVSGASMSPNFSSGDYLLVDELTYRFREPERGEVVFFSYPGGTSTYFIKRIIGLPGETVNIEGNVVTVFNEDSIGGFVLEEGYLPPTTITSGGVNLELDDGEYFVLGDNRSYSFDSRSWGVLPAEDVVGLARLRLWPLGSLRAFAAPQY
jgi:signal peptidase I